MEKYLKIKDGAKILYHLYDNYFNRLMFKETYVPLYLTRKQKERFKQYDFLTNEEIWAYDNGVISLPDKDLDSEREKPFSKKDFLEKTIAPLVEVFPPKGVKPTVNAFILLNQFLNDDFDKTMYWLCEEGFITIEEANLIVDCITKFLM